MKGTMSIRIGALVLCLTGTAFGQAGASSSKSADRTADFVRPSASSTLELEAEFSTKPEQREFRLLATNKTSTMQKEMNEAANAGFHFEGTMGGETSFGGSEVVVIILT